MGIFHERALDEVSRCRWYQMVISFGRWATAGIQCAEPDLRACFAYLTLRPFIVCFSLNRPLHAKWIETRNHCTVRKSKSERVVANNVQEPTQEPTTEEDTENSHT